jgi:hypothetical protein
MPLRDALCWREGSSSRLVAGGTKPRPLPDADRWQAHLRACSFLMLLASASAVCIARVVLLRDGKGELNAGHVKVAQECHVQACAGESQLSGHQ